MITTQELLLRVSLPELVPGLHSVARRYLAGPCPLCGGRDRFQVRMGDATTPDLWICRACGDNRYRNAIDFIMRRDGCGFRVALTRLHQLAGTTEMPERRPWTPPAADPTWPERGLDLVDEAEVRLWTADGRPALEYLLGRGLTSEAIRTARLGYAPAGWDHRFRVGWDSVTIPWVDHGRLVAVHLRAVGEVPHGDRYRWVAGGTPVLYECDSLAGHTTAILAEGELDSLLLAQAAGDLAAVVTVGSCVSSLSNDVIRRLLPLREVLVAFDTDPPSEAAAQRLLRTSKRLRRLRPPVGPGRGKDIGDAWKAGADLRAWVSDALSTSSGRYSA